MALMSARQLIDHLKDPGLRPVDLRWSLTDPGHGRRAYAAGHVPNATFLDLDADLSAPVGPGRHPLPTPAAFAELLGERGIGSDHTVVAYDDSDGTVAARLWWMLDSLGHEDARVLDGGIAAYVDAGGELASATPSFLPARMRLANDWARTIDRDGLIRKLGEVTLLDARAQERYRGEVEPVDRVPGHIPTAINAPASADVTLTGEALPRDALRRRYIDLGVEPAAPDPATVVSCGSGVTACRTALSMRVAGLPDPLLYPGSYSDWSKEGLPIASTAYPGTFPVGERDARARRIAT